MARPITNIELLRAMRFEPGARQVQTRLLRTAPLRLRSIEVSAACLPALEVGGDFYDLFQIDSSHLGMLLGDISGKGVSAAILMASLQAAIRSHYASRSGGLRAVLRSVNRLFFDWTDTHHFATLFIAEYDDRSHSLSYVNCGHLPPMLLRADGGLERLAATATVIGILPDWDCEVHKTRLEPGDTLLMFSDGVTETTGADDAEFGEERLADALRASAGLHPDLVISALLRTHRSFCGGRPADDTTVVVARTNGSGAV